MMMSPGDLFERDKAGFNLGRGVVFCIFSPSFRKSQRPAFKSSPKGIRDYGVDIVWSSGPINNVLTK